MSEWVNRPLGELCLNLRAGGTPAADNPEFYGGEIPFVTIEDMTRAGRYLERTIRTLSALGLRNSNAWLVPEGHLLYSIYATLGKVTINTVPVSTNQAILAIKPDPSIIRSKFLYYILEFMRDSIISLSAQTTQANLSAQILRKVQISFPKEFDVQDQIIEILTTLDETIEHTEALIAKTQQIKAGLMHDLFARGVMPDGRLRPSREEAPELYKESVLGWIPREWEVKKLGKILQEYGGYLQTGPFGSQLHAHEYQQDGIPVVMPQDIENGMVHIDQIALISEKRATQLSRHRMKLGDVVIARRGDLSRAAAITEREVSWVCGTGCFLLRLGSSDLSSEFASLAYQQSFIQRQVAGHAVGTTMQSLNNNVMANLLFPFCGFQEQCQIIDLLNQVKTNIQVLAEHKEALSDLKRGLMQKLISGNTRNRGVESRGTVLSHAVVAVQP